MAQLVSRAKNGGLSPEEAKAAARSTRELEAAGLYARFQARLGAFNAVDFDDLIRLPVRLLETDEDARLAWRERIGYLLVDECQDTNDAQYRLLKAIAGPKANFTCVGDDDQSIYAWRGANPENLAQLARDYPDLVVVKLEQNYRCPNRVLRAANALIAHNPHEHPKTLWSAQPDGERIRVWECRDAAHEAERVARDRFPAYRQADPLERCACCSAALPVPGAGRRADDPRALPPLRRHRVPGARRGQDALSWLRLVANRTTTPPSCAVQSPLRGSGRPRVGSPGWPTMRHADGTRDRIDQLLKQLPARAANAWAGSPTSCAGCAPTPRDCHQPIWCALGGAPGCSPRCRRSAGEAVHHAPREPRRAGRVVRGPTRRRRCGQAVAGPAHPRRPRQGGNQVLMSMHAAKGWVPLRVRDRRCRGHAAAQAQHRRGQPGRGRRLLSSRAGRSCGCRTRAVQKWGSRLRAQPFLDELRPRNCSATAPTRWRTPSATGASQFARSGFSSD